MVFGFLLGLTAKTVMLFYNGVFDMNAYYAWGKAASEQGLFNSFHGAYFPIQYQIFQSAYFLSQKLDMDFYTVFKLVNLLFDTGSFILLYALLVKSGVPAYFSLLYWIHPWFLLVFSLGYIDFHFAFFLLLMIFLLARGHKFSDFLCAGLPLGAALLMKPQALIIAVALFVYSAFRWSKDRRGEPFALFIFPFLCFFGYSIYFAFHSRGLLFLSHYFLNTANVMPCLTAQMLNLWHPVAFVLKAPGERICSISDGIAILPHLSARTLATCITLLLITGYGFLMGEKEGEQWHSNILIPLLLFASLVLPFVMTSAHENHLFFGSILLIYWLAKSRNKAVTISIHGLLIIQCINMYLYYGNSVLATWCRAVERHLQPLDVKLVLSFLDIIGFFVIIASLYKEAAGKKEPFKQDAVSA